MSEPETTVVPFGSLPSCAANCGELYDANGACVPPQVPEVDNSCFCNFNALAPFREGPTGACAAAGCDDGGLSSIQAWYTSYCSSATGDSSGDGDTATSTETAEQDAATGGSSSGSNQGDGGDWISNHWRWVIGIVILVVGIAGIWVGACIWRRRYLKRKERAQQFDKHSSASAFPAPGGSTVHVGQPGAGAPPPGDGNEAAPGGGGPGSFMPGASAPYEEKPKKKRWIVRDRT